MSGPIPAAPGPQPGVHTPVTAWSRSQVSSAWLVHGFTALGIVASMLALRDVLTGHPDYAILWLLLTLVIDGVDGPIARALMVSERVPRIDGFTLDLIIDYVACVIVPACFMYEFKVVPQNNFGIVVLCVMVFISAIWFARKDMMGDDYWFRGFPAAWNLVAPVMFLTEARAGLGAAITLVLSAASLTNLPFPHILRAKFLRPVTVCFVTILIGGIVLGTLEYPGHPYIARPLLYIGAGYFVVLAVIKMVKDSGNARHPHKADDNGMALPDSGSAEVIALLVVAGLGLVVRWVFKPSRPRRGRPADATDARELGLLSVIATVDRAGAAGKRSRLADAGIRASTSLRRDGRFDLLVFTQDVERARELLS